jgi:hypothetical protein
VYFGIRKTYLRQNSRGLLNSLVLEVRDQKDDPGLVHTFTGKAHSAIQDPCKSALLVGSRKDGIPTLATMQSLKMVNHGRGRFDRDSFFCLCLGKIYGVTPEIVKVKV